MPWLAHKPLGLISKVRVVDSPVNFGTSLSIQEEKRKNSLFDLSFPTCLRELIANPPAGREAPRTGELVIANWS
jgi:hypothetical protein